MRDLSLIREAFADVAAATPAERHSLLARLPEELRAEVQSLLVSHKDAGWFLLPLDSESLPAGTAVGPYLILGSIGQGGMGVVYRAKRADGEFDREVALKFVSGQPMAAEAERRFIAERRILAALDHPNIVRMLDGGVWRRRRFLAMELISGEPVTQYCEHRQLPLAARLRLFQQVCAAIQYAHQRMIVHCDIKPGNIFVTATGSVKVLDFGVARIVAADAEEETNGLFQPMTLRCASPEQARGEGVTLASDIYALGLLLHDMVGPAAPPEVEAIAAKAASAEPWKRYESAAGLAADVERFLERRPVRALPYSSLYSTRLFIARNRTAVAIAIVVLAAILSATGASIWQARRAERLRQIAEQRFDVGRRLLHAMIHEIQPEMAKLNGSLPLRVRMLEGLLRYMQELRQDAADSPPLLRELIEGYVEMAGVAGSMSQANVGAAERKTELLQEAQKLAAKLEPSTWNSAESLQTLAKLHRALAQDEILSGHEQSATNHARQALAYSMNVARLLPDNDGAQLELATANMKLGDVVADPAEAAMCFERAIAIWQHQLARAAQPRGLEFSIANAYRNLSSLWLNRGDNRRAVDFAIRARDLDGKALREGDRSPAKLLAMAFDLGAAGAAYAAMGQLATGADYWQRSIDMRRQVADANPTDHRAADRLAFALAEKAEAEFLLGHTGAARGGLREALAIYRRLGQSAPLNRQSGWKNAICHYLMGQVEGKAGSKDQACLWYGKAWQLLPPVTTPLPPGDARLLEGLRAARGGCRQ